MLSQPRRVFLHNKIMDLQQALFFNYSRTVLRFPVSIINVLQVDDIDQIWFMVHRPLQHLSEFEHEFDARLDFYRKGKNYYMHVAGKASIVSDPEEINHIHGLDNDLKNLAATTMVLVRMRISKAMYYPITKHALTENSSLHKLSPHHSAVVKGLQYIIKDIIPVFQSH